MHAHSSVVVVVVVVRVVGEEGAEKVQCGYLTTFQVNNFGCP